MNRAGIGWPILFNVPDKEQQETDPNNMSVETLEITSASLMGSMLLDCDV